MTAATWILLPGMRGDNVRDLQRALNARGSRLDVDGIYGTLTKAAVMDYQDRHGLMVDGIAGPVTLGKLYGEAQQGAEVDSGDAPMASEPALSPPNTKPPFPAMSSSKREQVFGRFNWANAGGDNIRILGNWESENIKRFDIPQLAGVPFYSPGGALKCSGKIYLHRLAGPIFQRFFDRVEQAGLLDRVRTFDGAFVPRYVRGSKTSLSNHSWGTAIDINAYANGLGKTPAALGRDGCVLELVPLAHECGLYWGGNFSRKDGMHFEVAVLP